MLNIKILLFCWQLPSIPPPQGLIMWPFEVFPLSLTVMASEQRRVQPITPVEIYFPFCAKTSWGNSSWSPLPKGLPRPTPGSWGRWSSTSILAPRPIATSTSSCGALPTGNSRYEGVSTSGFPTCRFVVGYLTWKSTKLRHNDEFDPVYSLLWQLLTQKNVNKAETLWKTVQRPNVFLPVTSSVESFKVLSFRVYATLPTSRPCVQDAVVELLWWNPPNLLIHSVFKSIQGEMPGSSEWLLKGGEKPKIARSNVRRIRGVGHDVDPHALNEEMSQPCTMCRSVVHM